MRSLLLRRRLSWLAFALCGWSAGVPAAAQPADSAAALARADAAWERRAEGSRGGRADAERSRELVALHEAAVEAAPGSIEAHWKLLRALYFAGEHAVEGNDAKHEIFSRARERSDAALALLAERSPELEDLDELEDASSEELARALADVPGAAQTLFWSTVDWGMWGETVGRLKAARQGLGGRIRTWAGALVLLDPEYESAGGHRLLGRLHTVAPKIPFFTGWVDRDTAIEELERAVALGPEEPFNSLYLAEAILEHRPAEAERAHEILDELARRSPRPDHRVEDAKVLAEAERLARREREEER